METVFFRLLQHDDKSAALADATAALRDGRPTNPAVHVVNPASFRQVPGSPFAYWVSTDITAKFVSLPSLERTAKRVCFGLSTKSDFQFLRLAWEVSASSLTSRWFSFVNGGEYSPFYADPHLVIDWENDGQRLKEFATRRTAELFGKGGWSRWINNWEYYFQRGLTWSRRSQIGLSVRALPEKCIFSDKGPAILPVDFQSLPKLLGLCNSAAFRAMVSLQMAFGSYEVGVIQRTPVPDLSVPEGNQLAKLALDTVNSKRDIDRTNETSHVFHVPALLQIPGVTLAQRVPAWQGRVADAERRLTECQREIDDIAFRLYGIEGEDRKMIEAGVQEQADDNEPAGDVNEDES